MCDGCWQVALIDLEFEPVPLRQVVRRDFRPYVEVPCAISTQGIRPMHSGRLPDSVRGLVLAVKAYERTVIRAVIEKSWPVAQLAMLEYPVIGQWEIAQSLRNAWAGCDHEHLGYLKS